MSRPKSNTRKLSVRKNGHGRKVYYVNIPDQFVPLFEYGNIQIEIEANNNGGITLTPVRKEVL